MQAKMFIHLITCMIPPVWGCSTSCSPDAGQNASDSFNEDSSIDGRSWRWFGAGKTRRGVIITNRLDHWRYHAWKGRCTDTFTVLHMTASPRRQHLCFKEGQNGNFEWMEMEKQVNKNDSDSSDIISKRKICIHLARRIKFSQCY